MKMNYRANTQDTQQGEFEQIVSSALTTRIGTSDPALGLFKAANQKIHVAIRNETYNRLHVRSVFRVQITFNDITSSQTSEVAQSANQNIVPKLGSWVGRWVVWLRDR